MNANVLLNKSASKHVDDIWMIQQSESNKLQNKKYIIKNKISANYADLKRTQIYFAAQIAKIEN